MAALTVEQHVEGVLAGDPAVLARTITLLESSSPARRADAQAVLAQLLPHSGGSLRVGITEYIQTAGMRAITIGIALGVAALIIVLSVMNGFQKEVRDRMLGVLSHVEVLTPSGEALPDLPPSWVPELAVPREAVRVLTYPAYLMVLVMLLGVEGLAFAIGVYLPLSAMMPLFTRAVTAAMSLSRR